MAWLRDNNRVTYDVDMRQQPRHSWRENERIMTTLGMVKKTKP
jgi:hypothetical protein